MLDTLCLTGAVIWGRLSAPSRSASGSVAGPIRTTPIAIGLREHMAAWLALARGGPAMSILGRSDGPAEAGRYAMSSDARDVVAALERRGASFFDDLAKGAGLLPTRAERALAELVALGLVAADGFGGLRALLTPSDRRKPLGAAGAARRRRTAPDGVETAGRWSLLHTAGVAPDHNSVEAQARVLVRRYGVVCRRVLMREENLAPWRDLVRAYRRLEARGELRGGRFVAGMPGEQFALPEAVGTLRAVRRTAPDGALLAVSAVDPLNLAGYVTAGGVVAALVGNRLVYRDGVPVVAREAGVIRQLAEYGSATARQIEQALIRRPAAKPPAGGWRLAAGD